MVGCKIGDSLARALLLFIVIQSVPSSSPALHPCHRCWDTAWLTETPFQGVLSSGPEVALGR